MDMVVFYDSYYYSTGAIGASAGAAALFSSGALFLGGKKKVYEYGLAWTVLNCVIGLIDNFFISKYSLAGSYRWLLGWCDYYSIYSKKN